MLRHVARAATRPFQRSGVYASMRKAVKSYGAAIALYYWVTNEMCVLALTYLLHYKYIASEDLLDVFKQIGLSRFVNVENIERKSWSFCNNRVIITARFLTNFAAASTFMSLVTPVQIPICIATFPSLHRFYMRARRKHAIRS